MTADIFAAVRHIHIPVAGCGWSVDMLYVYVCVYGRVVLMDLLPV